MEKMNNQRILREQEHFDKLADQTGEIWWGSTTYAGRLRKARRAQLILKAIEHLYNPLVLELGCGTGALTRYLLEMKPDMRLIGLDVSPSCVHEAIKRFKPYLGADFQVANAYQLPIESDSADVMVAASVIHHLDVEQALKESFRVLKPGGVIWFSEPNMVNPQVAIEKNVRFVGKLLQNSEDETAFFRWRIAKQLLKVGFQNVKVTPYDFLHPAIPKPLTPLINRIGLWMEKIPLIREISGSLIIQATKPN